MLEGGLMKFLAKGATEKIVEDADEKRERLFIIIKYFSFQYTIVPSMWFWSVSWSTNCPVYFSLFLVDQKKICSVSGNFWSGSDFFGPPSFFLVYQNFFLVYQKIRA